MPTAIVCFTCTTENMYYWADIRESTYPKSYFVRSGNFVTDLNPADIFFENSESENFEKCQIIFCDESNVYDAFYLGKVTRPGLYHPYDFIICESDEFRRSGDGTKSPGPVGNLEGDTSDSDVKEMCGMTGITGAIGPTGATGYLGVIKLFI
jgi:hypothetical protein